MDIKNAMAWLTDMLEGIKKDPMYFFKLLAPSLLFFSTVFAILVWIYAMFTPSLSEPVRETVHPAFKLFGVLAIVNLMVFVEKGPSLFLSIIFIGTVIAGPDFALKAVEGTVNSFTARNNIDVSGTAGDFGDLNLLGGGFEEPKEGAAAGKAGTVPGDTDPAFPVNTEK